MSCWYWGILAVILAVITGCVAVKDTELYHPIADVFKTALQVAAKVVANDGTQKLAIAAAQAAVISQVSDPAAQAVACQIIEAAVPKIATGIASVCTHCTTRKAAMDDKFEQYTESEAFGQLILECTQKYEKENHQ